MKGAEGQGAGGKILLPGVAAWPPRPPRLRSTGDTGPAAGRSGRGGERVEKRLRMEAGAVCNMLQSKQIKKEKGKTGKVAARS